MLFAYFPFSKLMHMGGVFLSPTRNLANNNRMRRHVNPWNPEVEVHTYAAVGRRVPGQAQGGRHRAGEGVTHGGEDTAGTAADRLQAAQAGLDGPLRRLRGHGGATGATPARARTSKYLGFPNPREWSPTDEDWKLPDNWQQIIHDGLKERLDKYRSLRVFMDTCVRCGACADKCHFFIGSGDPEEHAGAARRAAALDLPQRLHHGGQDPGQAWPAAAS